MPSAALTLLSSAPLLFSYSPCCTQNDSPFRGSSHCRASRLTPVFSWRCCYRAKSIGCICTQTNCICFLVGVHNYHFMKITAGWGLGGWVGGGGAEEVYCSILPHLQIFKSDGGSPADVCVTLSPVLKVVTLWPVSECVAGETTTSQPISPCNLQHYDDLDDWDSSHTHSILCFTFVMSQRALPPDGWCHSQVFNMTALTFASLVSLPSQHQDALTEREAKTFSSILTRDANKWLNVLMSDFFFLLFNLMINCA